MSPLGVAYAVYARVSVGAHRAALSSGVVVALGCGIRHLCSSDVGAHRAASDQVKKELRNKGRTRISVDSVVELLRSVDCFCGFGAPAARPLYESSWAEFGQTLTLRGIVPWPS